MKRRPPGRCAAECTGGVVQSDAQATLPSVAWYNHYMSAAQNFTTWFDSVRPLPVPKFITGLRGTGKTALLLGLRERLLQEGLRPERALYIDTENPSTRRFATHTQMIDHVLGTLPATGRAAVFVREAAALPDPEVVIGTLAASSRREVFATSSSRRLLEHGLAGYFSTRLARFEVLPEDGETPYDAKSACARWNEIFLHDVLTQNRIYEVSLAERIAGWLSDNLGDPVSLRGISAAISPSRRFLSPHTIEAYLASLEDAYLVERAIRWDIAEDAPQQTGYRYFFTDPRLRIARFGPAPSGETRRMLLNRAWLRLRRAMGQVYVTSGSPEVDFMTRVKGAALFWRMNDKGRAERVHFNAQF